MKRIGHLFERVVEPENLRLAFLKASRGKRPRQDQRFFQQNLPRELRRLREGLVNLDYPVGDYKRFKIYEPKEREICAASFGERVMHHALMNVCEPYFDRWLVFDSYACRVGKGQLAAVRRAQAFARKNAWFMKCDFRKYFDSIPHAGVSEMLARRFKDVRLLANFNRILASYEKTPARGLPIGNLTSQHFANLYLDPLDRFLSRAEGELSNVAKRIDGYVRYMDDFVFWSNDRDVLLTLRDLLTIFVSDRLGLAFKQEPFINRTDHGMDFLGLRVYPQTIRLSRQSRIRYGRKLRAYERLSDAGMIDELELQARVTALTAFVEEADTRGWRRHHLALHEELRARTVSFAAGAGTTMPATAAPRIATGTGLATATTTSASASFAPQHRRMGNHVVPVKSPFSKGTNTTGPSVRVDAVDAVAENPEWPF